MPLSLALSAGGGERGVGRLPDGLSALVSVPVVVGAGHLFSKHLAQVRRDLRVVELGVLAVAAAGLAWLRHRQHVRARARAG